MILCFTELIAKVLFYTAHIILGRTYVRFYKNVNKTKTVIDRQKKFSDTFFRMNYLQDSIGFVKKIDFGIIRVKD